MSNKTITLKKAMETGGLDPFIWDTRLEIEPKGIKV